MNENTNQKTGVEADLDVLITIGVVERKVKPFKGKEWEFTMHTLTNPERVIAAQAIPNSIAASYAQSQDALKEPTLVQAITEIDMAGKKHTFTTPQQKEVLRGILSRMGGVMLDMVYIKYLEMSDDMVQILDTGVKKN